MCRLLSTAAYYPPPPSPEGLLALMRFTATSSTPCIRPCGERQRAAGEDAEEASSGWVVADCRQAQPAVQQAAGIRCQPRRLTQCQ